LRYNCIILIFREIYFSLTLSTQQNKLYNFIRTEYTYELSFYFVKYLKHAIFRLKTIYNSYVYLEDHGGHVILVSDISTFLVITYTSNSIFRSSCKYFFSNNVYIILRKSKLIILKMFSIPYHVAIYINSFFFDSGNKSLPVQSKSQHIHWIVGKAEDTEKDGCHALLLLNQC